MKRTPISAEQFDAELAALLETMTAASVLSVPGVYEVLSEHFNNEVIERCEDNQAEGNPS